MYDIKFPFFDNPSFSGVVTFISLILTVVIVLVLAAIFFPPWLLATLVIILPILGVIRAFLIGHIVIKKDSE